VGGVSRTSSPYFGAGEDGGLGIRELTESVSAPSKNCVGFVLVRAGFKTEREQLSNVRTGPRGNSQPSAISRSRHYVLDGTCASRV
jgi:hypothetical protein